MMTDIVERLRLHAWSDEAAEAADEIKRLRAGNTLLRKDRDDRIVFQQRAEAVIEAVRQTLSEYTADEVVYALQAYDKGKPDDC